MNDSALNRLNKLSELNWSANLALLLGVLLFSLERASAQTNVTRPVPGRYLLIVETSHPMKSRADGILKTAANLLINGMGGQIKAGDSIGVWTYNQELYAGKLPLQRWSSMVQRDVISVILSFLKEQKYEKQPAFSSIRPALEKVVKDSEWITIVLISSGDEPMVGTPFDDKINELYKTWREEQQKTRMPFVTVIRAKRGTIIGYSVTPSPWQVEMPAWPPEPVVKAAASTPPRIQASTVPPLIVTGKKPKSTEATNASESVTTTPGGAPNTATTASPPKPGTNASSVSGIPEPTVISSAQKSANPASDIPVIQRNAAPSPESPQPSEHVAPVTNPNPKAEALAPAPTVISNASTSVAVSEQTATPSEQSSTGVATPGSGIFSNKIIWIGGLAVLGIACVVLVVVSRRPRAGQISLITRSLEREKK